MHSSTVASRPIALPNAGRSWVGSTRTPRRSHEILTASGLSLKTSAAHAARIPGSGWTVKHGVGRAAEGERAGDGRGGTLARGLSNDSPTGEAERDKVGSEGGRTERSVPPVSGATRPDPWALVHRAIVASPGPLSWRGPAIVRHACAHKGSPFCRRRAPARKSGYPMGNRVHPTIRKHLVTQRAS